MRHALTHGGELSVAARPQTWLMLCRSNELRPQHIVSRSMFGEPVVVFRTREGAAHTLAAHCVHMGTHLGCGHVVDDRLRCAMHHWTFDGEGRSDGSLQQRSYPTVERFGVVWAFNGPRQLFPPPAFDGVDASTLRTALGPIVTLRCPWFAVAANAFDVEHLRAVHERELRDSPDLERLDPYRLQFRYVSRVTGRGIAAATVRRLSNDHVNASIICSGGTVLSVESRLGRRRSLLLLGLAPSDDGATTVVQPIFAVGRGRVPGVDRLHALGTRWLFTAFLERDVRIMHGMRFAPRMPLVGNEPLLRYLELLDELPSSDGTWTAEH